MELRGVLIVLLSSPIAVIIVFAGLAISAGVTYVLSIWPLQAQCWEATPGGAASRMPWWQVQHHLWRHAWAGGVRRIAARTGRTVFMAGLAGYTGYLASFIVTLPFYAIASLTGHPISVAVPLIPAVGVTLSLFSLAKCLRYLTGRTPQHRLLRGPEFRLTDPTVRLRDRVEFNRKIYLYTQLRWAVRAAASIGPALAAGGFVQATYTQQPSAPATAFTWTTQNIVGLLIFGGFVALGVFTAGRLQVATVVILSPAHAAIAVQQCLRIAENGASANTVGWARDPLGVKRTELNYAALALTRAGQRLDRASQGNPIASVILGCAHYIRQFLTGNGSLTARYPAELPEILTTVLAVLAGPTNPEQAAALGDLVHAFDTNGQPNAELRTMRTGRWTLLVGRAGESLDRYARIATAIWAVFSLVVVTILIVTHHLDLTKFQLQK